MGEQFISEEIQPVRATMDTARMASGEPGLPGEFHWRGKAVRIEKVLRQWRETRPCRHGSGEQYLHKYWYEIRTNLGQDMKIYFLRPAKGNYKDSGWRLFSLKEGQSS
jgi:phosphoribosylglycinamide formyltransferase-1